VPYQRFTVDLGDFVVHPHLGPYSLFRFLGELFVVPLGPVGAVRALASLPVLATPAALSLARFRLHGDSSPTAAFYGVALGFGLMTLFGFASYLLGIAALVVALTAWLEHLASPLEPLRASRLELAIAFFTPLLLFVHGDAFLIFLGLAVVSALSDTRFSRAGGASALMRLRALIPATGVATWSVWTERRSAIPAGSVPLPHATLAPHFQGALDKLSLLVTPTLFTRTGADAVFGLLVWGVVLACAWRTGRSIADTDRETREGLSARRSRALLTMTAAVLVLFGELPHSIGWFGFVDGRTVPLLLVLPLMAIRPQALSEGLRRWLTVSAPLAATGMVCVAFFASYRFQVEAYGWREVLRLVPDEARLLYLPLNPNSEIVTAHPSCTTTSS
jgi:hypothetical protein